jgi:hypothetical protein
MPSALAKKVEALEHDMNDLKKSIMTVARTLIESSAAVKEQCELLSQKFHTQLEVWRQEVQAQIKTQVAVALQELEDDTDLPAPKKPARHLRLVYSAPAKKEQAPAPMTARELIAQAHQVRSRAREVLDTAHVRIQWAAELRERWKQRAVRV